MYLAPSLGWAEILRGIPPEHQASYPRCRSDLLHRLGKGRYTTWALISQPNYELLQPANRAMSDPQSPWHRLGRVHAARCCGQGGRFLLPRASTCMTPPDIRPEVVLSGKKVQNRLAAACWSSESIGT